MSVLFETNHLFLLPLLQILNRHRRRKLQRCNYENYENYVVCMKSAADWPYLNLKSLATCLRPKLATLIELLALKLCTVKQ